MAIENLKAHVIWALTKKTPQYNGAYKKRYGLSLKDYYDLLTEFSGKSRREIERIFKIKSRIIFEESKNLQRNIQTFEGLFVGEKKIVSETKRRIIAFLIERENFTVREACNFVQFSTSSYYYRRSNKDDEVKRKLLDIRLANSNWGFDRCFKQIRSEGHRWNRKRVWRVYSTNCMQVRKFI